MRITIHNLLLKNLTLALIYALLGIVAIQFSATSGYSSPFYPAAGLAFVAVLLSGARLLPGVVLGALATNIYVAATIDGNLSVQSITIGSFIAIGVMLQSLLAATLVKRILHNQWRDLENEQVILKFLTLAGPVASLLSASIGTGVLWTYGILTTHTLFFSWCSWWIGDTLGVMLFSPILLVILFRKIPLWKKRIKQVLLPSLTLIAITLIACVYVANNEKQQIQQKIAEHGVRINGQLAAQVANYLEIIDSLNNFVLATPNFTQNSFNRFTQNILLAHPDIQGLGWNPLIDQAHRASFERKLEHEFDGLSGRIKERDHNQKLIPGSVRPTYVAVEYIQPLNGNMQAIGYDIFSDPLRKAAILEAIKLKKPIITAPVKLTQETGESAGVLLLNPTYLDNSSVNLHHQYNSNMPTGFSVAVLRIENTVNHLLSQNLADSGLILTIDDSGSAINNTLFSSSKPLLPQLSNVHWQGDLPIGGRIWHTTLYPTAYFIEQNKSYFAWLIMIAALFMTGMLQVFMLSFTGRATSIQRIVDEQTQRLSQQKKLLDLSLDKGEIATWELYQTTEQFICSARFSKIMALETDIRPTLTHFISLTNISGLKIALKNNLTI